MSPTQKPQSNLFDISWVEKYRPKNFNDLVFEGKETIKLYLKEPKSIPSFLFYSSQPGTGKTSTARLIAKELGTDLLVINASDERGIDVIRERVKSFAQSMSSISGVKRCIFLDEADGLTKQAQESMKAMMEQFSNNCFFVLSCNDVSKIIEPVRKGRTLAIDFSKPPVEKIILRLQEICHLEKLEIPQKELENLCKENYPDIRSMVLALQTAKVEGKTTLVDVMGYQEFMKAMKEKNIKYIYERVYSGNFDLHGFLRYYFQKLFEATDKIPLDRLARVSLLLAEIEKNWAIGTNYEMVFLANILEIVRGS